MSAWVWVAIVGAVWVAGLAIAVGLARSAALGERIEAGEQDPGAGEPRHVVGRR